MGLEQQGGISPSGKPSETSHPTPPERGYLSLNPQTFPRREFLSLAARIGGALVASTTAPTLLYPEIVRSEDYLVDRQFLTDFIAGGDFMEPGDPLLSGRVFEDRRTKARVILPDKAFASLGFPANSEQFSQRINNTAWGRLLGNAARARDAAVLVEDGEVYLFRKFSPPRTNIAPISLSEAGEERIKSPNGSYQPKVKWSPVYGVVLTDDFRITHQHNKPSNSWVERDEYVVFGDMQSRISKSLRDFINSTTLTNGTTVSNILGLNPQEVEDYINGITEDVRSFTVLSNAQGEPAFFAVTDGDFGLKPELGNAESLRKAVERLNQIDPTMINQLTKFYGLRGFTYETAPGGFFEYHNSQEAGFDIGSGLIMLNEYQPVKRTPAGLIATLLLESRHIFTSKHIEWRPGDPGPSLTMPNRLHDKSGVDKAFWLRTWAEDHRDQLTKEELHESLQTAQQNESFYLNNPNYA